MSSQVNFGNLYENLEKWTDSQRHPVEFGIHFSSEQEFEQWKIPLYPHKHSNISPSMVKGIMKGAAMRILDSSVHLSRAHHDLCDLAGEFWISGFNPVVYLRVLYDISRVYPQLKHTISLLRELHIQPLTHPCTELREKMNFRHIRTKKV